MEELPGRNEEESRIFIDPAENFLEPVLVGIGNKGRQRALCDRTVVPEAADSKEKRGK